MQIGITGLGRMGANIARRLMRAGHECVVHDVQADAITPLIGEGATGASSLEELARQLHAPRTVWMMVPAAVVDQALTGLEAVLRPGDIVIDGGNSHYRDTVARAARLKARGLHYVDVGTSGGVWGLDRGYCLMIGGETTIVEHLDPVFATLAPGLGTAPRTPGREQSGPPVGTAELGYLHCGAHGAGHFAKMIHNGIEYGMMAAFAEGFNILRHADLGGRMDAAEAAATPSTGHGASQPTLPVAEIAEVWRRGSVISSWLLDLVANALAKDSALTGFEGRVSDSGEGRWALQAAIDEGVPAPVLSAALFDRFTSRGAGSFAHMLLSAMRHEFGGHVETGTKDGSA